jgi:hypothetical protein
MKIYVATSWRNKYHQDVVTQLRGEGYDVYDFKGPAGFSWSELDPDWLKWDIKTYIENLKKPRAEEGFDQDFIHLKECEVCVYLMPCGHSASIEAGWAQGAGKLVVAYAAEKCDPDLMVKMFDTITDDFTEVKRRLRRYWKGLK